MYWVPVFLVALVLLVVEMIKTRNFLRVFIITLISTILMGITVAIDFTTQTMDTEVWSGQVTNWNHKEEWDEWHQPETTCTTTTDSKGNSKQECKTKPGYWEHHDAENYIYTTDNGWISVSKSPDGKKFNDSWPNEVTILQQYWPNGTPSASAHTYVNKIQASYSTYRHKDLKLEEYKYLPEYPKKVTGYINVDRILGDVPNKDKALQSLAKWNTELNKTIPDPDKPGKTKSWKQVNLIFVNVGVDKPQEAGFALQDKWEGGNKNDFVVSFSTDKDGNIIWTYPFSWSEVEILKIQIRDYMNSLKSVNDFTPVVDQVANMVAKDFVRKQFADFSYLQIELSTVGYVFIYIECIIAIIVGIVLMMKED